MMNVNSITRIAGLIGEAGRIQMLAVLLDGNRHSAGELAMAAAVSPQTASSHLSKMVAGSLVVVEHSGRQRLYRLKNADVAAAVEALAALAQPTIASTMPEIRFARSCYDHLAGVLAIALRDELLRRHALRCRAGAFVVTPKGNRLLRAFDIDLDALRGLRRSFAHPCLDWTERHHHIGGALGSALLVSFFEMKWIARMRDTRAVRLTHAGEQGFERFLRIPSAVLRARPRLPSNPGRSDQKLL
jgi:DNA-binding transcriptional ArsR family regulator